jgi:hypothetical protein
MLHRKLDRRVGMASDRGCLCDFSAARVDLNTSSFGMPRFHTPGAGSRIVLVWNHPMRRNLYTRGPEFGLP